MAPEKSALPFVGPRACTIGGGLFRGPDWRLSDAGRRWMLDGCRWPGRVDEDVAILIPHRGAIQSDAAYAVDSRIERLGIWRRRN
jgi:hypothetical protein